MPPKDPHKDALSKELKEVVLDELDRIIAYIETGLDEWRSGQRGDDAAGHRRLAELLDSYYDVREDIDRGGYL